MFAYPKKKISDIKEFVKTHPTEVTYFAAGVISTVAVLKFRDRNNTVLVMKSAAYKETAGGRGIVEFKSKYGNTTLLSSNYVNKK